MRTPHNAHKNRQSVLFFPRLRDLAILRERVSTTYVRIKKSALNYTAKNSLTQPTTAATCSSVISGYTGSDRISGASVVATGRVGACKMAHSSPSQKQRGSRRKAFRTHQARHFRVAWQQMNGARVVNSSADTTRLQVREQLITVRRLHDKQMPSVRAVCTDCGYHDVAYASKASDV
jgi:hypothetical protein